MSSSLSLLKKIPIPRLIKSIINSCTVYNDLFIKISTTSWPCLSQCYVMCVGGHHTDNCWQQRENVEHSVGLIASIAVIAVTHPSITQPAPPQRQIVLKCYTQSFSNNPTRKLTTRTQSLVMLPIEGTFEQAHCESQEPEQSPNCTSTPSTLNLENNEPDVKMFITNVLRAGCGTFHKSHFADSL